MNAFAWSIKTLSNRNRLWHNACEHQGVGTPQRPPERSIIRPTPRSSLTKPFPPSRFFICAARYRPTAKGLVCLKISERQVRRIRVTLCGSISDGALKAKIPVVPKGTAGFLFPMHVASETENPAFSFLRRIKPHDLFNIE